jgi:hypothetical protein
MRAYWIDVRLEPRAWCAAFAAAAVAAGVAGFLPMWARSTVSRGRSLAAGGVASRSAPRRSPAQRALVVVEVAIASALLLATGLLVKSAWALRPDHPGLVVDGVVTGLVTLSHLDLGEGDEPAAKAGDDREGNTNRRSVFEERLLAALARRPEVSSAALATGVPGAWRGAGPVAFTQEGAPLDPDDLPETLVVFVTPSYFDTLGTAVLRGRVSMDGSRTRGPMEVVVNRSLAEHLADTADPDAVGARLRLRRGEGWVEATVVGVVADQLVSMRDQGKAVLYAPIERVPPAFSTRYVLVRSRAGTEETHRLLRDEVARVDRRVAIQELAGLEIVIDRVTWTNHMLERLLSVFASAAFLLAGAGIYAVMTFSIEGRVRELGIRAALGARAADLRRLILREGLSQVGLGLIAGTLVGAALVPGLRTFLYGVDRCDPIVWLIAMGAPLLGGLLATLGPALRAARGDPAVALREE